MRGISLYETTTAPRIKKLATEIKENPNLTSKELEEKVNEINKYTTVGSNLFFANRENGLLKILITGPEDKIIKNKNWAIAGAGKDKAYKIMKKFEDQEIIMDPQELSFELYDAINNAAKYNEETKTGGYFNLGIMKENSTKVFQNEFKLNNFPPQ